MRILSFLSWLSCRQGKHYFGRGMKPLFLLYVIQCYFQIVCSFSVGGHSHIVTSISTATSTQTKFDFSPSAPLEWPTISLADGESLDNLNIDDAIEISDLPPPYVPLIFAVLVLLGVGLLTGSLGDVYSEEASLGFMSGAKAKKEAERSRSSYFKNK